MAHEFTAGPWRQYERDQLVIVAADGGSIGEMTCGGPPGTTPHFEQVANARLAAQSPRLLMHLEKAYKVLTRLSEPVLDNVVEEATGEGAAQLMDAIQRAIGDAGGSTE
jgi:hypothetical protein